uniref:Uncharacterized protein n=1 Tax=Calcidiscus leptoporus TaxID=127549 RepID=A0A7S0J2A2_9EUKA
MSAPDARAHQVERRASRNPLLRQRDVVMIERQQLNGKRMTVLVLALFDLIAVVALFFQLSSAGFPTTLDMVSDALDSHTLQDFWFIPAAVASAFPIIGALGAILLWQHLLWTYCGYLVGLISLRLYFLFEAGRREGLDGRDDLLLDMMLLTFGIFLQVYIFQSVSTLGLLVRRLKMQNKFLRSAPPRSRRNPAQPGRRASGGDGGSTGGVI